MVQLASRRQAAAVKAAVVKAATKVKATAKVEAAAGLSWSADSRFFPASQSLFPPGALSCAPSVGYTCFSSQPNPSLSERGQETLAFLRAPMGKGEGGGVVRNRRGARRQAGLSLRGMVLKVPQSWDP